MPQTAAWLALALAPGIGPVRARALLARHESPAALLNDPPARWRGALREGMRRANAVEAMLARTGGFMLTPDDPRWPEGLAQAASAPLVLFGRGDPALLARHPRIAITGGSRALPETRLVLRRWAGVWREAGTAVLAGLEGAADRAALQGAAAAGMALAASGLARLSGMPAETAEETVAAGGLVLAALPPDAPGGRAGFAQRAHLLALLADGVLVAEADLHSRALGVAHAALDLGREVMAMPGPVWSERFAGAHRLIREGALLVDAPEQVLEALGAPPSAPAPREERAVSGEGARICALLADGPMHVDAIAARLGLTMDRLLPILLALEMEGVVERLPGGRYARRK